MTKCENLLFLTDKLSSNKIDYDGDYYCDYDFVH